MKSLSPNFKTSLKFLRETVQDFKELCTFPFKFFKYVEATNFGHKLRPPKSYFKKTLNEKQIETLGNLLIKKPDGTVVYKKTVKMTYNGHPRITFVYTNVSPDKRINKVVVQTKKITQAWNDFSLPRYGVMHVWGPDGNKVNHVWQHERFQGPNSGCISRIVNIRPNDNAGFDFHTFFSNTMNKRANSITFNNGLAENSLLTYGKDLAPVKEYIEKHRIFANSPRAMSAIRRNAGVSQKPLGSLKI